MSRIPFWLRTVSKIEVLTFILGLIIPILLQAIAESLIPVSEIALIVLLLILTVTAVTVILVVQQHVSRMLERAGVSAQVYFWRRTSEKDTSVYNALIEAVGTSKESILAVSLYKPTEIETTKNRERYYIALHEILEAKLQANEEFRFERVIQVKDIRGDTIASDQIDSVTYNHCEFLLKFKERQGSVSVRLWQIQEGIVPVSFVLVDNQKVVFLIPSIARDESNKLLSVKQIRTELVFDDRDGRLTKEMSGVFDELRLNSVEVLRLQ